MLIDTERGKSVLPNIIAKYDALVLFTLPYILGGGTNIVIFMSKKYLTLLLWLRNNVFPAWFVFWFYLCIAIEWQFCWNDYYRYFYNGVSFNDNYQKCLHRLISLFFIAKSLLFILFIISKIIIIIKYKTNQNFIDFSEKIQYSFIIKNWKEDIRI